MITCVTRGYTISFGSSQRDADQANHSILLKHRCSQDAAMLSCKVKPLNLCPFQGSLLRLFSSYTRRLEYKRCYEILGVTEDSDQETIRKAYIDLVKIYHPDSGTKDASAEKFQEIDKAFKVLISKLSLERWNAKEEEVVHERDIEHTAPQHRQYLSHGGYGSGNPFQREKQYIKYRAQQAAENVLKHRMDKSVAEENTLMAKVPQKHKMKTKYGLDRLVEDLIQESMSRGEFDNLSGKGKPLQHHDHHNPYVDFVTHKLNQVLIDNGFTPEWITLQKEIRDDVQLLRYELQRERSQFGSFPLSTDDHIEWSNLVYKFEKLVTQINRKINQYNLVVPMLNKQLLLVDLRRESQRILKTGKFNRNGTQINCDKGGDYDRDKEGDGTFFGFLEAIFKR